MRWFLFVYFILSGVTWVAGNAGKGVAGRVALPDVFLPVLAVLLVVTQRVPLRFPPLAVAAVCMLISFTPGVLLAPYLTDSLLEWGIFVYALFGFFVIYNLVVRQSIDDRVDAMVWWCRAGTVIALIGIYDLFAATTGLPRIAGMLGQGLRSQGGLVGTFRNTGQAGSFIGTVLAVALPLSFVAGDRKRKLELTILTAILVLALVLTVKRAALLGMGVGGTLFLVRGLQRRQAVRTLATLTISVLLLVPAYRFMDSASAAFRWRIAAKLSSSAGESVQSFAATNYETTRDAFLSDPIWGVGMGTITASGARFEIHSTYLNILASAGIVGVLGYLVFVWWLFRSITRPRNDDPRAVPFARLFLPMMLGLMLSYGYTNHLRKREFWITAALVSAFMAPAAVRRTAPPPLVGRRPGARAAPVVLQPAGAAGE
ncbi:MAG TPA: O-antigen ligase family protein [Longimicrobium sp.]|nr:O-antigen ligase family protein [Longimicrobium sp.]